MAYGFDTAHNKVDVATSSEYASLAATVATKQEKLNSTGGVAQADADELVLTGIYYIPSTADNVPSAHDYVLVVCAIDDESSGVMQVAISTNGTYIYTRMYVNSAWTAWKRWASYSYVNNTFPVTYSGDTVPDDANGKNGDHYYYLVSGAVQTMYVKLNDTWMEVITHDAVESE